MYIERERDISICIMYIHMYKDPPALRRSRCRSSAHFAERGARRFCAGPQSHPTDPLQVTMCRILVSPLSVG